VIDRPLVLPAGMNEFDLQGDVTILSGGGASLSGFAGAAGVEIGLGKAQLGLVMGLPIAPDFNFGSIYGSAAAMLARQVAIRVDAGYDRGVAQVGNTSNAEGFASFGLGFPLEMRLGQNVSFVSGRVGAMNFARFLNFGQSGVNVYLGRAMPFASADLFSIVHSLDSSNSSTLISVNLPVGLLVQVSDPLAVVFHTGYQALIASDGGATEHYIPLGFDAILSPSSKLDVGASVLFPGYVGGDAMALGYADWKIVSFWMRLRS
jgi:hypothetical protein